MRSPITLTTIPASTDLLFAHVGEIGKLLGTKLKELSDEEKKVRIYAYPRVAFGSDVCDNQPYIEQAERDRERADKEKKDYDVCFPLVCALYIYSPSVHRKRRVAIVVAVTVMKMTTSKLLAPTMPCLSSLRISSPLCPTLIPPRDN